MSKVFHTSKSSTRVNNFEVQESGKTRVSKKEDWSFKALGLYPSLEQIITPIIDVDINRRSRKCFGNKLQRFRAPSSALKDFPSRETLYKDEELFFAEEHYGEEIFFQPDKEHTKSKPPITYWRRAEHSDIEAINKLIENASPICFELFGEPDVPNLIEKSSFPLVQFNSEHKLISFTTAFSYPHIPAVPSFEWYPWLDNSYKLKEVNPRNSFFIHFMVWEQDYYYEFLKLTLETMFVEYTFLNHVIITKPPKVKLPSIVIDLFVQVLPNDSKLYDCDYNCFQTILLCLKHSLLERLKIRMAIVEDHDDLMPIVEQHTDRLRQLYGDFCMAEIIEFPGTKDRKTLVCESMGYAVGFMTLNRTVDFELLNSQFDLGVFHGLRKPDINDKITSDIELVDEDEPIYLPEKMDPYLDVITSETILKFLNWEPSLCARIEDLESNYSEDKPPKEYNQLNESVIDLLKDTMILRLIPKFSAHALSVTDSNASEKKVLSESELSLDKSQSSKEPVSPEEIIVQTEPSLISLQHFNLPVYHGAPNAFLIEFFAMHKNFDDRLCHDFLEAAFEAFPDLDYCLLTLPSQCACFPLLDFFTRVTPRPLKRLRQELYVCHKSSVMITFMRVRRIVKNDLNEIQRLLFGIKNKECIFADIASSCFYENSAYQGFALICFKSIVGVAVLCNENGMEYLAHHYHVSDLIDFELHKIDYHAILKHLVLSPIYQPHARFFLRDIMRMADVTSLYRTRYEEAESYWTSSSLITALGQLVPVKPRRMVFYHEPSLEPNVPPQYFLERDFPFSLYHINSRICGLNRFTSNIQVVIVGSSRTAFGFLEALLFAPSSAYVTYNNITLVSPHGMGTELPSHPAIDCMFPFKGKFNRFYKIQMCLKTYVNFVYGVMTEINRVEKYITINNDSILPYDYLILLCGRQNAMPVPNSYIAESKDCQRSLRPRCSLFKYLMSKKNVEKEKVNTVYPPNVFLINTVVDATNALISLQYLMHKNTKFPTNDKIIIYGYCINSFLCVQGLLKFGIPGKLIVMVQPPKKNSAHCFSDPKIEGAVLKTLKSLNIECYEDYVLQDWILCENLQVSSAIFHSFNRKISINCLAMFPFEKKLVSEVTFKACNEASLVYDGKLVINSAFQTNDPSIYAAGGLTTYKRCYFAKDKNHIYFSSNEIGKNLADIIRKKIDPTEDYEPEKLPDLVPEFTQPNIYYGVLPDDWHFLSVRKPGKFIDPESRATLMEYGNILITGDCEMSQGKGYFKLTLNDYGFVEEILCYTHDSIEVDNITSLYGKHEKLLNNLLERFDLGMIQDLYSYFREPWVYAIYHDKFKYLTERNYKLFFEELSSDKKDDVLNFILDELKANKWNKLDSETLKKIEEKFNESTVKEQIIENILDFLSFFDEPFPMYATPKILRILLRDALSSIFHTRKNSIIHTKSIFKTTEKFYK